jgi:gas vesicle protein
MNLTDLRNLDKDEILGMLGLETKTSTGAWLAGSLGTFGVGLLVGAGIALMLAPKPGRELREDIRDRLRRAPEDLDEAISGLSQKQTPISGGVGNKSY